MACSFTQSASPASRATTATVAATASIPRGPTLQHFGGCDLYGTHIPDITSNSTPPPYISTTLTDPTSTLFQSPGSVTTAGLTDLVRRLGEFHRDHPSYGNGASGKGVAMWDLDNEPTWWDAVHRDVHPVAFTYDEVTNNGIGTALAIKTADPTARSAGR